MEQAVKDLAKLEQEVAMLKGGIKVCERGIENQQEHLKKLRNEHDVMMEELNKARLTTIQLKADKWLEEHRAQTTDIFAKLNVDNIAKLFVTCRNDDYTIILEHVNKCGSVVECSIVDWVSACEDYIRFSFKNKNSKMIVSHKDPYAFLNQAHIQSAELEFAKWALQLFYDVCEELRDELCHLSFLLNRMDALITESRFRETQAKEIPVTPKRRRVAK